MAERRKLPDFGRFTPVIVFVAVIWAVQIVNMIFGYRLNPWFGLEPRDFGGLIGVPAAPFLHGSIAHAAANTIPLLILGGMALAVAPKRFPVATVIIVLLGGALVWLFARGGLRVHVGASGLVFGYAGFLIALAVFERSWRAMLGAVAVVVLYGGMIWGVLPTDQRVSWESHLFGFLAGGVAAWLLRKDRFPSRV